MTHNFVYKLFCKEVQLRKDLVLISITLLLLKRGHVLNW